MMKSIEPTNKDYLTPKHLESEFGISINKQYKMRMKKNYCKNKAIPFIKIGKVILYKRSEIERWLDDNTVNKEAYDE